MKTALILGSSGLTGSHLLKKILEDDDYNQIILINRSKSNIKNDKIIEVITDFKSEINLDFAQKIDSIFSCLGTTKKKTPNLEAYKKIEIDIPFQIAKVAIHKELKNLHLISSVGASSKSSNFYLKIKGEAEEKLSSLQIPFLHIYRPSFLVGERKENRITEKIFSNLMPLFTPFLVGKSKKYKAMLIENLSESMINIDKLIAKSKVQIHEYESIMENLK